MPFTVISHGSPARPIKGYYSRRLIRKIEKDFNPDIVYSIGFPSYVRFKSIELGRYTNPWEFYEDLPWFLLSFSQKLKVFFRSKYRLYWAKKAKFIETQTETAKNAISKKMKLDKSKIFVIHNSINQIFLEEKKFSKRFTNNEKIIFCLAARYHEADLQDRSAIWANLLGRSCVGNGPRTFECHFFISVLSISSLTRMFLCNSSIEFKYILFG